jgi:glycosyltransferase involved in cell wall biosynthesis
MMGRVKRCAIEGEDWLRYSPLIRSGLSRLKLLGDAVSPQRGDIGLARSIATLCAAARLATSDAALTRIMERIHRRVGLLNPADLDWTEYLPNLADRRMARAAILKPWVDEREKGVVFISYEGEWIRLFHHCDVRQFARRYTLVIAPSSSPHNLINYVFPAAYPDPIFTLISNRKDLEVLPRVSPKYVAVPLYASSWVNPEVFQPRPWDQRDIDLIMVANFGKVKRHHVLFKALRQMPARLRVLLVGQDQDSRTADTIRAEARCFGVDRRFEIVSNATYFEVVRALCRSRTSVVLSRREGSCVVVAESLFADTPVGLLQDAEIGSRAFLNPATGRFLRHANLAAQLVEFIETAADYSPRQWAQAHISCFHSTRILNDLLKRHLRQAGQDWTQDIAPLYWCPDPCLVRAEDRRRLAAARDDIRSRFGLDMGPLEAEEPAPEFARSGP